MDRERDSLESVCACVRERASQANKQNHMHTKQDNNPENTLHVYFFYSHLPPLCTILMTEMPYLMQWN